MVYDCARNIPTQASLWLPAYRADPVSVPPRRSRASRFHGVGPYPPRPTPEP